MTSCNSTGTPCKGLPVPNRVSAFAHALRAAMLACLWWAPAAADWPHVRGGAEGVGVATAPLPDQPELLWTFEAKEAAFEATAVILAGTVFIGDDTGRLHALALADGSIRWTQTYEDAGFSTAAVAAGERLYTVDVDGVVRCHQTQDGVVLWAFKTESEAYNGPNLYEGLLLVTTEAGELIALDQESGVERWRYAIDGPLRCSPSVSGGYALLAGCDARLTVVDAKTGVEVGAVDIGGQTGCTAALRKQIAYFGTEAGEFLAIDYGNPKAPRELWRYRDPRRGQGIRSAAAVTETTAVYGSNGKAIYGMNTVTGRPRWIVPQRTRVESSPVIAGGHVVTATGRGQVLLLDLDTGQTVWEYEAGGRFVASPAVSDGRLVIGGDNGTLYCFGKSDTTADSRTERE